MTKDKTFQKAQKKLAKWYTTRLGENLFAAEKTEVNRLLTALFGYHAVQIGIPIMPDFLENSRIPYKTNLLLTKDQVSESKTAIHCSPYQLPVASNSIDLAISSHLLEYARHPYQALQEIARILVEGGHVIIIGFNPWSLWGLWRILLRYGAAAPWCGKFICLTQLKHWLLLLDLELIQLRSVFFRPPIQHQTIYKKALLMEKLGRHYWPACAAVYIILAKKHIVPLTPTKLSWHKQPGVIAPGAIGSSSRKKV